DPAVDSNADQTTGFTAPVTYTSGQVDNTVDAGFYQVATIGDFIWHDTNGDGIQDAGESGISNVVVNLLDANSNIVASTTTDMNGAYAFTNVVPGTYAVEVVPPTGYTFSSPGQGGDTTADSDINPGT